VDLLDRAGCALADLHEPSSGSTDRGEECSARAGVAGPFLQLERTGGVPEKPGEVCGRDRHPG
jgi:hypothetical protein